MGNHKFKLSEMIPNAWFFKLKDMAKQPVITKPRKHRLSPVPPPPSPAHVHVKPLQCHSRKSYHFTREDKHNPNIPKSIESNRRIPSSSSVSTTTYDSLSPPEEPEIPDRFDNVLKSELPRIVTRLKDHDRRKISTSPSRRFSGGSPAGVRLKVNSPRVMTRKQGQGRKSVSSQRRSTVSESFAVVKSSRDPQRDFKESMVEMIVENNLTASKDLEDLLACYLCLNSDEYHDVIIKVFKQIWFDLIYLRKHKLVS